MLRARVERSNLEPLAIQARNDRELALLELKRLLNVPVDQPLTLVTRIDSISAASLLASDRHRRGLPIAPRSGRPS